MVTKSVSLDEIDLSATFEMDERFNVIDQPLTSTSNGVVPLTPEAFGSDSRATNIEGQATQDSFHRTAELAETASFDESPAATQSTGTLSECNAGQIMCHQQLALRRPPKPSE